MTGLRLGAGSALLAVVVFFAQPAGAHVAITAPAPGAVLMAGDTVRLSWYDSIPHYTEAYDIDFLPAVDAEPLPIAHDVPPTTKEYDWVVPDSACSGCFVRVFQRNINYASFDHTLPIVIEGSPAVTAQESEEEAPTAEPGRAGQPAACSLGRSTGAGSAWLTFALGLLAAQRARRRKGRQAMGTGVFTPQKPAKPGGRRRPAPAD